MNFSWTTRHPPTTEDMLARLEAARGIVLPDEYRTFILVQSGGYTEGDTYLNVEWNETFVDEWFGSADDEFRSIHRVQFGDFSPTLSNFFLQFACEPGGGVLAIDLREEANGEIVVYAPDSRSPKTRIDTAHFEALDLEGIEQLHSIAPSFEAFLNMLGPEPDDD